MGCRRRCPLSEGVVSARDSTYRLRAAVNATWDVFISYSSNDKAVVRAVAERLRADGLQVWFDAWEIRVGDSIPAKIEEGLEHSRVLVLCMSANAFGSDWARLESGTFRFRDPLNKNRRFIPLRLDDAPAPGSLAQFRYVDWREGNRNGEYQGLRAACRQVPPAQTVKFRVRQGCALQRLQRARPAVHHVVPGELQPGRCLA